MQVDSTAHASALPKAMRLPNVDSSVSNDGTQENHPSPKVTAPFT